MARTKKSQSKHDKEVLGIAKDYEKKGYDVKAEAKGFGRPAAIGGVRPDVVAMKGKTRKIVEVETPDSVGSARDEKQKEAFRKAAKRSKNTTFRRTIVK